MARCFASTCTRTAGTITCCCTIGCWNRRDRWASTGSAFRAIAGFGRHGVLHEEHFFELAGEMTVQVELAVSDDEAEQMIARIREEGVTIFYVRIPIEFGSIGN